MKKLLIFSTGVLLLVALSIPLLAETVHCDGTISVFFATPSNDTVDEELCSILQSASSTVDIAIYSFTLPNVAHTLEALALKGVVIRILMEAGAPGGNGVVCSSVRSSTRITLREVSRGGIFHHKVAVLDGETVITGSFNWSDNAQDDNWENLIVISCPALAASYTRQFNLVWNYYASPGCPPVPSKLNINTATKSELMELPAIGDARSNRIIAYRNAYPPFSKIEDIMKVPYIGKATFAQIKDLICVGGDCDN